MPKAKLSVDKKYKLYESSVQCIGADVDFINKEYKKVYKKSPLTLREDFGGTGALACEWTTQSKDHFSWAVDLDDEPMKYGKENHYVKLDDVQKTRVQYIKANVLEPQKFKADVIVAFNFSYFIFKERKMLLNYFKEARKGLNKDGIFMVDIFGGTECRDSMVEETEHDDHSYFWDCDKYNPLTNEVLYYIHFEQDGKRYDKAFTYDWRMWTVAEIKDIMLEAGFSKTITYWEGDDEDGDGDGNFFRTSDAENCESWVTYICALA